MFDKKDFESQVQQKLQELDFSPSASVWHRIEAQLPPEKKRRGGFIIWSSLIAAAVAAGGFFFLTNKTVSDKANNSTLPVSTPVIISGKSNNDNKPSNTRNASPRQQNTAGEINKSSSSNIPRPRLEQEESLQQTSTHKATVPGNTSGTPTVSQPAIGGKDALAVDKTTATGKGNRPAYRKNKQASASTAGRNNLTGSDTEIASVAGTVITKNTPVWQVPPTFNQSMKNSQGVSGDLSLINEEKVLIPTYVQQINYKNDFHVSAIVKEMESPASSISSRLKKMKRWSFELSVGGGQSTYNAGTVNKLFTSADPVILNFSPLSFGSANGLYAAPPKPSEVEPGIGFSIGANTRYKFNRRLSVTAGINYSLLTTKIATGQRSGNSTNVTANGSLRSINEFYATGSEREFTNNYHFIELPLLLYFQLNRGRVLPLYVHGGLSYARMIKSNSLHYDGQAKIYYKANDVVRRNFVNVEGGISARLFARKKYSLLIGPEIQYGLTNLLNNTIPQNDQHSLFIGVKASVPLHF